jgi:hypothetical protein
VGNSAVVPDEDRVLEESGKQWEGKISREANLLSLPRRFQ